MMEKRILLDSLKDSDVDPDEIEYVETHGTGTIIGDQIEVNSLTDVFTKNRKRPLLIGTVKSNLGHTEASAGICGMIKAILTFENGIIPPNIKYEVPKENCLSLVDGRIKVVTEPTPFNANYIPVNNFGNGGTLVTTVLKKNHITYKENEKIMDLPRLVLFPGTAEKCIAPVFEYIQNTKDLQEEFFALLNKLSYTEPSLKPFRGYLLLQKGQIPQSQIK
ncbi:fatty acid synthase, partial [Nephila pilipes]